MKEKQIKGVIKNLEDLQKDITVPRNIKIKIQNIIEVLKEKTELSIRINKALNELDEVADDVNMQSYTRAQIWNIVSSLEKINA